MTKDERVFCFLSSVVVLIAVACRLARRTCRARLFFARSMLPLYCVRLIHEGTMKHFSIHFFKQVQTKVSNISSFETNHQTNANQSDDLPTSYTGRDLGLDFLVSSGSSQFPLFITSSVLEDHLSQ